MELDSPEFRFLLNEFKKGKVENFYTIIDISLYLLEEELLQDKITDELVLTCFVAFIQAIKNYTFEKATTFANFVSTYVHLSKLVAIEGQLFLESSMLELYLPSLGIHLETEDLMNYVLKVKENIIRKRKNTSEKTKIFKKS